MKAVDDDFQYDCAVWIDLNLYVFVNGCGTIEINWINTELFIKVDKYLQFFLRLELFPNLNAQNGTH